MKFSKHSMGSMDSMGPTSNINKAAQTLYAYGLAFLTGREVSQKKLFEKLCERSEPEMARHVLERLVMEGWVSDRRFAESYLNYRSQRGFGPRYIENNLREAGLSRELIKSVFMSAEIDWEILLEHLIARKFPEIDNKKMRDKAERFLVYRGFEWSMVNKKLGRK